MRILNSTTKQYLTQIKLIVKNYTKVMSDRDISQNHQSFKPYHDIPNDNKNTKTSTANSSSSRSFSGSSIVLRRAKTSSLDVNLSTESSEINFKDYKIYESYDTDNSIQINVNSGDIISETTRGKFLDWLSECFWKCSFGCQELPTMK